MKKSELDKKLEDFKEENIDYYKLADFYMALAKYRNYLIEQKICEWEDRVENRQLRTLDKYET